MPKRRPNIKRPNQKRRKTVRKSAQEQRERRPRIPLMPENDEDMLSEFSDDTNTFYTDERVERKRRKKEENQAKKEKKKAEKRKPMSPTRRKIIRILSYGAIIAVVLIVGVVLSLTVLFKTQAYEVTGNTKYTEEELIETCGIGKGENIFLAPKTPAENRLKKAYPYIEEATVSFKIPDTIRIAIIEASEGYLVKISDTNYLVISTKGRILNQLTDAKGYDLPIFIGPTLTSGEVGDYVSYEDESVLDMIESITQTFADNGYTADISFTYDDRIKVKLGIPEDLDYKVRTAMTIISENLDKNQTGSTKGILDVSRCNSTKRSYFNEQEIHPTEVKPTEKPTENGDGSGTATDTGGEEWVDNSYTYDEDNSYTEDYSYNSDSYVDYGYYGDYGAYNGDGYYE